MEREGFDHLVREAQRGDRAAMDEVLEVLRPHLEHLARPFADPARPAESTSDLLQETCLRAWQRLDGFEGGKNDEETFAMFRSWIGQIVHRLGLNAQRDRGRQRRSPPQRILPLGPSRAGNETREDGGIEATAPEPTPSAYARADERSIKIQEALDDLPDAVNASIVRMRFFDAMTIPEISERLGLGYEQVRERYRSTLRRLERHLEGLL